MNLSVDSNSKAGDKEHDEQLLWTKDILGRLHDRYYSQELEGGPIKTVPEILVEMRREVLLGKKIVLSGLVPLHRQNEQNSMNKPRPDFIRYVENMGACLSNTVQRDTSFVVAKTDGTDKILQGRRTPGCCVVKRSWLMQCYWSLTSRDPQPHVLPALGRERDVDAVRFGATIPSQAKLKPLQFHEDEDDSDEDDDDFAAEFEKEFM